MHLLDVKFLKTRTVTSLLLPDNIHPENSIYYNSAFVIESLKKGAKHQIVDLYQEVKFKKSMSLSIFVLCLDWLFLVDVVRLNANGEIELC